LLRKSYIVCLSFISLVVGWKRILSVHAHLGRLVGQVHGPKLGDFLIRKATYARRHLAKSIKLEINL